MAIVAVVSVEDRGDKCSFSFFAEELSVYLYPSLDSL